MTIIKRCEKEVQGTWADKQRQQAILFQSFAIPLSMAVPSIPPLLPL